MSTPTPDPVDVRLTFSPIAPGTSMFSVRICPLSEGTITVGQVYMSLIMALAKLARDAHEDEEAFAESTAHDLRAMLTHRDGEA
jgi:hypothetical protein